MSNIKSYSKNQTNNKKSQHHKSNKNPQKINALSLPKSTACSKQCNKVIFHFLFYFLWVHHQKTLPFNKPAFLQTEDINLSESLPSRRQNWRIHTIVTHYSRGPMCTNISFYKTCYSNPVMQLYFVFILLSSRHNKNTCLPVFCNHRILQFAQYIFIVC